MMQTKENQQFNVVKENILPVGNQIKSNALQPKLVSNNGQNKLQVRPTGLQVSKQTNENQIKPTGLQVHKQANENLIKPTGLQVHKQANENISKPTALQAKPINQLQNTKGIHGKIQKENGKRQSLKPIKNEIVNDGKIKKLEKPAKANSGSKLKKTKKDGQKLNSKKDQQIKLSQQQQIKPVQEPSKENDCDFVIFCDENDELAIKAVEKENQGEVRQGVENVDKKKGLAERNLKPQSQTNVQVNLQIKTIQQQITIVEKSNEVKSIERELIKEAETLMSIDLSKDEIGENTINTTIENKENDPTLMSIDQSALDLTKDEELESQCRFKDVSGDMVVKEFSHEIYVYMLEREKKFLPDAKYMEKQPEVNSKMRAMLVDWLIDVGIEYELDNETVFLTISYIDQFLSSLTISLQNFQLLGTAALFIASKYEEIYPPELKDFIFVTDDAYTKLQMLSMEKVILKSLNFNVSPPTIQYFLKYFLTKLSLPIYVQHFAEYLCFLSLLQDSFLCYSPSDIAISSIILAIHTYSLTDDIDYDEFKQLTRIHNFKNKLGKQDDFKAILTRQSCVNALFNLQKNASEDTQQAVFTKYSSSKYLSVANVELADELPEVVNFFY